MLISPAHIAVWLYRGLQFLLEGSSPTRRFVSSLLVESPFGCACPVQEPTVQVLCVYRYSAIGRARCPSHVESPRPGHRLAHRSLRARTTAGNMQYP